MRVSRAAWVICSVVMSLGQGVHAAAEPSDVEQNARSLLAAGVEETVSPTALAQLGPELPGALLAIFSRPSEARYVRLRALSMLAHVDQARVTELFVRLLREGMAPMPASNTDALHPARSSLVLRKAIEGLAGRSVPDLTVELVHALDHRDPWVRRAAVLMLAQKPNVLAAKALETQLGRETSVLVLKVLTDRSARPIVPRSSVPESAPPPR